MNIAKITFKSLFSISIIGFASGLAYASDSSKDLNGTYQKPGADIKHIHNLKSQLSRGGMETFTLTLNEGYGEGALEISLGTNENLEIYSTSNQASFDMSKGKTHTMDISFRAKTDGRHFINVFARAVNPSGQFQTRVFSIPVQVGAKVPEKPHPGLKTLKDGTKVIEMKAAEEVIFD